MKGHIKYLAISWDRKQLEHGKESTLEEQQKLLATTDYCPSELSMARISDTRIHYSGVIGAVVPVAIGLWETLRNEFSH